MSLTWREVARSTIEAVASTILDTANFAERKAKIEAAYPFGPKAYWPRKAWLKARELYLRPYDPKAQARYEPIFSRMPRDPATGRPLIK